MDVAFDDFDAGEGFVEAGVEEAEFVAHGDADGAELAGVVAEGEEEADEEEDGDGEEAIVEEEDEGEGGDGAHGGIEDGHEAGAEHLVDGTDVVGGAGHEVAEALLAVEGLAFGEEVLVEFVTDVAFEAAGEEFVGTVAEEGGGGLGGGGEEAEEAEVGEGGGGPVGLGDEIEAVADDDGEVAVGEVIDEGGDEDDEGKPKVATGVANKPACW